MVEKAPVEIWETMTESTVWVRKTDPLGREGRASAGGRVGARLLITAADREINQQLVADPANDPFTNGLLAPVKVLGEPEGIASPNSLTRAQMAQLFAKTGNAFQAAINRIDSEVTLRTLRKLADEVDASQSQVAYLDKRLEPFKVTGRQQKVYRELEGLDTAGSSPGTTVPSGQ
jgi:hypothetical protein